MERTLVYGDSFVTASFPDDAVVVSPGYTTPLPAVDDLHAAILTALREPVDGLPLRARARRGARVTVAFDDPTVPCYAPVWAVALPAIVHELEASGVRRRDIGFLCANALHRKFTQDEIATLAGEDFVRDHRDRLRCHDAEADDEIVDLGVTEDGHPVEISKAVADADLTIYLNCSTVRGFSGGWKSICVGLSTYRSIHGHHSPDIMSMSLDRNRMHEILDRMGAVVEGALGSDRIFKIETVLSSPFAVHTFLGGSVGETRRRTLALLRTAQPPRRDLVDDPADVVVYGVPDWSPYAAFSHGNPILDIVSTGLGYLGGALQAVGKPGCTVIMTTPAPPRWDLARHPSYREVWETVLPETRDPDQARRDFEPALAARTDYLELYRNAFAFHPVHAVMALYPLKRLRHVGRVVVVGAADPAVPRHLGFDAADTVEEGLVDAMAQHGPGARVAIIDNPPAFNRA